MFKEVTIIFVISIPLIMAQNNLADLYDDKIDQAAVYPYMENTDYSAPVLTDDDPSQGSWNKRMSPGATLLSKRIAEIARKIIAKQVEEQKRRSPSRGPLYVFKRMFNQDPT